MDEEWEVEKFTDFKKSKRKNAGGYELLVKWVGFPASQNTWEPMNTILDGFKHPDKTIYQVLESLGIKLSKRCENFFDFQNRKEKQVNKLPVKTTKQDATHKPKSFKQKKFLCESKHNSIDLVREDDRGFAKKGFFLYQAKCSQCDIMFVDGAEKGVAEKYRISRNSPVYVCCNSACTYYTCGNCYVDKILANECKTSRNRK